MCTSWHMYKNLELLPKFGWSFILFYFLYACILRTLISTCCGGSRLPIFCFFHPFEGICSCPFFFIPFDRYFQNMLLSFYRRGNQRCYCTIIRTVLGQQILYGLLDYCNMLCIITARQKVKKLKTPIQYPSFLNTSCL